MKIEPSTDVLTSYRRVTRKTTRTPPRTVSKLGFSTNWEGVLDTTSDTYQCNLIEKKLSNATISVVCAVCPPPPHALEEIGSEIRPKGCVCVLSCALYTWYTGYTTLVFREDTKQVSPLPLIAPQSRFGDKLLGI